MSILNVDQINNYYGESHVLRDVSLDVDSGEIVSLLGRNGAGKTTTVRSVMGLTPPRSGSIHFRDDDITGRSPEAISNLGVTLIPEDRSIFPYLSVEENLRLGGFAHEADEARLDTVYKYFPRLQERMDQQGGHLSGGEQQMLAIGRGLMTDPDLLMLDEPTEGLAPLIIETLIGIIEEINDDGVSILLIEQNAKAALELSDRNFILETGEIIHQGTTEELKEREELLEKLLGVKGGLQ